jgi:Family of unknown function (DUF6931)
MDTKLAKIAERSPREVCARADLGAEALALLDDGLQPEAFLRVLLERELYADATKYLAHALPKRETVWWGLLVVRSQLGEAPPAEPAAVLAAAERWVRQPTDEHRYGAMKAAEGDMGSPASMVGIAAFMSGGSMAPAGNETVAPPAHLTGTMVASAVILCAVSPDPLAAPAKYKAYLAQGIEIAKGPGK